MMDRRDWLTRVGFGLLGLGCHAQAARARIDRPVPFDTPEADAILANLQVFPEDDPWNVEISSWPVHPRSKAIVSTIGVDKPLRYNPDMGFILVPPDQPRVPVRIQPYAEESDPGPFPVPDDVPIEG